MGEEMTHITPFKGFSMETGGTLTVIIASKLGIPVIIT
jgi:phosphate/sulfate permease